MPLKPNTSPYRLSEHKGEKPWQQALHAILFDDDHWQGRAFDIVLLAVILLSVTTVMAESVDSIRARHGGFLLIAEWTFTLLFTIEYVLRLLCVKRPMRYATSFFGIVDFLAVAPTYLGLLLFGGHSLVVVRVLRLARVFRILKLGRYVEAGDLIGSALKAARHKIIVFLIMVLTLVVIIGTLMYLIEGPETGFTDIPRSMYWAIVTLTTVGYGDIAPQTFAGQTLAALVMILGYSIIAVPTGIVTAEFTMAKHHRKGQQQPVDQEIIARDPDVRYCKYCGSPLSER